MELQKRLANLKEATLKQIEKAAKTGDTTMIVHHTGRLQQIDKQLGALEDVHSVLEGLERLAEPTGASATAIPHAKTSSSIDLSPAAQGTLARQAIVEALEDRRIKLIRVKGSSYRTEKGGTIGIAYASERRPHRWFLGLPDQNYQSAILLCKAENGQMLDFTLPKDFFELHKRRLSKVAGQLKFNVAVQGGIYKLLVPGVPGVTINRYLNNPEPLRS